MSGNLSFAKANLHAQVSYGGGGDGGGGGGGSSGGRAWEQSGGGWRLKSIRADIDVAKQTLATALPRPADADAATRAVAVV